MFNVTIVVNISRGQALPNPMRARQCLAPMNNFNFNPSAYTLILQYAPAALHNATTPAEVGETQRVS
jgi:hypothetical protein